MDSRTLTTAITTHLSNTQLAQELGGNCDDSAPTGGWVPPATWASSNFNPGKPTSLDALNGIVYIGSNKSPFLEVADTNGVAQGTSSGLFTDYDNDFEDDQQINDIKVAKYPNGNTYAFAARGGSSNKNKQFEVIDVSDINNPVSLAELTLSNVDPDGSYPQGWRLHYYDEKVYIVTRYTAGPEFHVIDVSNPASPFEIGSGQELGRTVESFIVTKKVISGSDRYFVYAATDKDTAPLSIFEVNPSSGSLSELTGAEPVFTDYQDGQAVFLVSNKLYFGRMSDPGGAELFVYDVSNPLSGSALPLLGSANIGTSVLGLVASGPFVFLNTAQANKEFKVWRSDPANLTSIYTEFNFPNLVSNGIKYENDWVYVASEGNDALRILYSSP
jgi:hypothetical protein